MSTLATYKQRLTEKIAQTSTAFHTTESRVDAINEAIQNLAEGYDIPDLIKKASLVFAGGLAAIPADFFRMIKIFLTAEVQREFTYLIEDLFDVQAGTSAEDFWTIDFDIGSGTRMFMVKPTTATTFTIRYVRKPTTLVLDSDDSGIGANFDDVIAYWAASVLLRNESNFPKATENERKARELCVMAIQSKRKQGGVKQGERLRSRFEKYPLLQNRSII